MSALMIVSSGAHKIGGTVISGAAAGAGRALYANSTRGSSHVYATSTIRLSTMRNDA